MIVVQVDLVDGSSSRARDKFPNIRPTRQHPRERVQRREQVVVVSLRAFKPVNCQERAFPLFSWLLMKRA